MKDSECNRCDPRVMAVAIARWCLGVLFLFLAIGKFQMGVGAFADMMARPFDKTWLPPVLVSLFGHALPFWEFIVGALLLLGLFRNAALFATGVLLILLTFGQVLLGDVQIVFFNTAYTFMAAAVLFLGRFDKWVLFPRPPKGAPATAAPPAAG